MKASFHLPGQTSNILWVLAVATLCMVNTVRAQNFVSKVTGPPAFFLRDVNDGICLAGSDFRRCTINSLWYVVGKPGRYQIHKRAVEEDGVDSEEELCLVKTYCHMVNSTVELGSCHHCGANNWNILGDSQTGNGTAGSVFNYYVELRLYNYFRHCAGYILADSGNSSCVRREGDSAVVVPCAEGYLSFNLQCTYVSLATTEVLTIFFTVATRKDILAMETEGSKLVAAAAEDDLPRVIEYLDANVDVNSRDWNSMTPLMAAASSGYVEMTRELLRRGARINLADNDNITALMEASMRGHYEIVELLGSVEETLDVNMIGASEVSALWVAAGGAHVDIVKFLVSRGADVNNVRHDGISVLMAACAGGSSEIARMLLEAGARVDDTDADGVSAIVNAAEIGNLTLVKALLEYNASVDVLSTTGFTALIVASAHGHLDIVKELVERGATLQPEHPEGVTAIMYAAAGGYGDIVSFLIGAGADVNVRHNQGGSALLEACTNGNYTVVQLLVDHGADVSVVDTEGVSALMLAAASGDDNTVRYGLAAFYRISVIVLFFATDCCCLRDCQLM
jgi:ankyrin repeat protein